MVIKTLQVHELYSWGIESKPALIYFSLHWSGFMCEYPGQQNLKSKVMK